MECDPKDVALKSLFLGPQAENADWLEGRWKEIFQHWIGWRKTRFSDDGPAISEADRGSLLFRERQSAVEARLAELLRELDGESPKFTPRFLGHMTSELALPAMLGHLAVLLHNPNLTSTEVSAVTSRLEKEAVSDLLGMLGLPAVSGRGHFTSGGTVANFEALWRALHRLDRTLALELRLASKGEGRENFGAACKSWQWFDSHSSHIDFAELEQFSFLRRGPYAFAGLYQEITGRMYSPPVVLVPESRHFSWPKAVTMLGLGREALREITLDEKGRMSLSHLEKTIATLHREGRPVLMVVSVAGGTSSGSVDPVGQVQDLLDRHRDGTGEEIWHHVDAAYGGYFCSLLGAPDNGGLEAEVAGAFAGIARVNSVTLDPHKLGFVPYNCGAFFARSEQEYRSPSFDAPYLLTGNDGAWQNTLEGSRAATGAVATWMACKTIGLGPDGYGRILGRDLLGARALEGELAGMREEISVIEPGDLNILCFFLARQGQSLRECNERTLECFRQFQKSPNFSVSKTEFSLSRCGLQLSPILSGKGIEANDDKVSCIRVVLMNPFFHSKVPAARYEKLFVEELFEIASRI